MSNNRSVEGFWSAGSEGRVIAEKSGVVVAQCLWQEDAELIVALRNNQRVAQLESAVARVEAAAREAGIHLAPGTPSAAQLADAIARLAADGKRLAEQARHDAEEMEVARRGWRDEIALREADAAALKTTRDQMMALESKIRELESTLGGEQRREAFDAREKDFRSKKGQKA